MVYPPPLNYGGVLFPKKKFFMGESFLQMNVGDKSTTRRGEWSDHVKGVPFLSVNFCISNISSRKIITHKYGVLFSLIFIVCCCLYISIQYIIWCEIFFKLRISLNIWDKVNFIEYIGLGKFLKAVFHKIYLVHSSILCLI